jgi:hypothetical protein
VLPRAADANLLHAPTLPRRSRGCYGRHWGQGETRRKRAGTPVRIRQWLRSDSSLRGFVRA